MCASSGSVGFWPIIPAALRSQLRSHAHIWHSFLNMITIHLPLWVWLCGIFPSFPSGTGATFQKLTTHPISTTATPYSLCFIPPPHCLLLIPPPPAQIPAALQLESSGTTLFPPESAVCVCRHDWVIWQRHLFSDLPLGWGRKGRNGGGGDGG